MNTATTTTTIRRRLINQPADPNTDATAVRTASAPNTGTFEPEPSTLVKFHSGLSAVHRLSTPAPTEGLGVDNSTPPSSQRLQPPLRVDLEHNQISVAPASTSSHHIAARMRLHVRRKRSLCSLLLLICCGSSTSLNQWNSAQNHPGPTSSEDARCFRQLSPFHDLGHPDQRYADSLKAICLSYGADATRGGWSGLSGESSPSIPDVDRLPTAESGHSRTSEHDDSRTAQAAQDESEAGVTSDGVTDLPPPDAAGVGQESVVTSDPQLELVTQLESTLDVGQDSRVGGAVLGADVDGSSRQDALDTDGATQQPVVVDPDESVAGSTSNDSAEPCPFSEVTSDNKEPGPLETIAPLLQSGDVGEPSDEAVNSSSSNSLGDNDSTTDNLQQNETENATASILNDSIIDGKEAMPSFDEWKRIRLEQEFLHEVPSQTKTNEPEQRETVKPIERKRGRRNYASIECGAKLVSANPGAESASKVLLEAKDEYMLNPCNSLQKDGMWFIVELCESIHPTHIELANFELYSSTGREFVVYMGDHYQAREWTQIGRFEMAQLKTVQSFPLDALGFGKAVKVEFLSIYENNQYYCPLSLVRVFGTSMVDDYEEKVSEDAKSEPDLPVASPAIEPTAVPPAAAADENMVSRAKQAMINIISSVSKAVSGSSRSADTNCTDCVEPNADNESKSSAFVAAEFDSCFELTNLSGLESHLWPSMKCRFAEAANVHPRSCPYRHLTLAASMSTAGFSARHHPSLESRSPIATGHIVPSTTSFIAPTSTRQAVREAKTKILLPGAVPRADYHDQTGGQHEDADEGDAIAGLPVQPVPQKTEEKERRLEDAEVRTAPKPPAMRPAPVQQLPTQQQQQQAPNLVLAPQPILPMPVKGTGQQNGGQPTPSKENLFSRFENRIKKLELHMNLSGTYLEELSRRYRKQMEEMQAAFNKTVAVLNAEAKKGVERDHNQQVALAALQEKLTAATESLRMLEAERDSLWWRLLLVYLALLVASVALLILLLYIVPRRAVASFIQSDALERRLLEIIAARERKQQQQQQQLVGLSAPPTATGLTDADSCLPDRFRRSGNDKDISPTATTTMTTTTTTKPSPLSDPSPPVLDISLVKHEKDDDKPPPPPNVALKTNPSDRAPTKATKVSSSSCSSNDGHIDQKPTFAAGDGATFDPLVTCRTNKSEPKTDEDRQLPLYEASQRSAESRTEPAVPPIISKSSSKSNSNRRKRQRERRRRGHRHQPDGDEAFAKRPPSEDRSFALTLAASSPSSTPPSPPPPPLAEATQLWRDNCTRRLQASANSTLPITMTETSPAAVGRVAEVTATGAAAPMTTTTTTALTTTTTTTTTTSPSKTTTAAAAAAASAPTSLSTSSLNLSSSAAAAAASSSSSNQEHRLDAPANVGKAEQEEVSEGTTCQPSPGPGPLARSL